MTSGGADRLEVSTIGHPGHWEVVLEVNGNEWKRYGPWADLNVAQLYAKEALRRADKVATKLWKKQRGKQGKWHDFRG